MCEVEENGESRYRAGHSSAICVVNTLRVDLAKKRITVSSSDKGVTKDPFCKWSDRIATAVFVGQGRLYQEQDGSRNIRDPTASCTQPDYRIGQGGSYYLREGRSVQDEA